MAENNNSSETMKSKRKKELLDLMEQVKEEILRIKANEEELGKEEAQKKILELLEAVKLLKEEIRKVEEEIEEKIEKEAKVEEEGVEKKGIIDIHKYRKAWLLVVLTFGIGDIATTYLAFQGNATEGNPILRPLLEAAFWLIIPFKILIIILIFFVSWYFVWAFEKDGNPSHERIAFAIVYIMTIVGIVLMISNIYTYFHYK